MLTILPLSIVNTYKGWTVLRVRDHVKNPGKPPRVKGKIWHEENIVFKWSLCPNGAELRRQILVNPLFVEHKQGFKDIFLEAVEDLSWRRVSVMSSEHSLPRLRLCSHQGESHLSNETFGGGGGAHSWNRIMTCVHRP